MSGGKLLEVSGVRGRLPDRVGRTKTFRQPQRHQSVHVHYMPIQREHAEGTEDAHPDAFQQTVDPGSHGKIIDTTVL